MYAVCLINVIGLLIYFVDTTYKTSIVFENAFSFQVITFKIGNTRLL